MKLFSLILKYTILCVFILGISFFWIRTNAVSTVKIDQEYINTSTDNIPLFYVTISVHIGLPKVIWNGENNHFHEWLLGSKNTISKGLLRGDLGVSIISGLPVIQLIEQNIFLTMQLMMLSFIIMYGIGIILGIYCFIYSSQWISKFIIKISFILYGTPRFALAIFGIFIFSNPSVMNIFPSAFSIVYTENALISQKILFWVLPVLSIALSGTGFIITQTQHNLLLESEKQYALFAKVKGFNTFYIIRKHLLKNALFPLFAFISSSIPALFSGSLIIEVLFSIPGMGKLLFDAYLQRDYGVMNALFVVLSLISLTSSFMLELFYLKYDTRRLQV